MLTDAANWPADTALEADLCIVGAGAAGIATALQFEYGPVQVLVLESGGLAEDARTQQLYAGSVVDEKLHSPPDTDRQRRFGGSTTIWGGRCVPMDPIDFERRDFIPLSGWPLDRASLDPFYAQANRLCEAGEYAYTAGAAFRDPARPVRPIIDGFASPDFTTDTLERFSCPTDFGARYGHRLRAASNIRVLLGANVTGVNLSADGTKVESLTVQTLGGRRLSARARVVVLAVGGLEVARLLLASRDVHRDGVGNAHDVVGRYYMAHLAGTLGSLKFNGPLSSVHHGYDIAADGTYCRQRIAVTAQAQRRERIGNFVARLHHPRITDPAHHSAILSLLYLSRIFIPYEYAKRLHGDHHGTAAEWLAHLRNLAGGPFDAVRFAWHMLRDRRLAERKFPSIIIRSSANLYSLDFHAEQQPNAASRVTLGDERDALGMPRIRIDWRYTAGDVDTVCRAIALLARDINASGLGRFDYDPATVEFEMTRYGAYGGHHIGTTRMGDDPRTSVVDADCRVHGVRNLYIAGAAVFPTSSQANPTLTLVALALRLAGHLKKTDLPGLARTVSAAPVTAGAGAQ
jgi:choline dehydrogenase-like flavoprotein